MSGQGLCETSARCEAGNAYFIQKAREGGDRVKEDTIIFNKKFLIPKFPWQNLVHFPPREKKDGGKVDASLEFASTCSTYSDSSLLGDADLSMVSTRPPIAARPGAVREFYASKQNTVRNLKHTKHLNYKSVRRHLAPGASGRGAPPREPRLIATISPRKGHLKLAGFGPDWLKVVGAVYAASREPWLPPRLGRFQVRTPGRSQLGEESWTRAEPGLSPSRARAGPEQSWGSGGAARP